MSTAFPTALDAFVNPSETDTLDSATVPHAAQHADANDAIEALQVKVGITGSADAASLDYRVAAVETGKANSTHAHAISDVTGLTTALSGKLDATEKGAANGLAPLGADSKIAATYLPSYVDDVVEAANYAALPATGETGKIYVTLDTNKTHRWSGSAYVEISASPGSTDAVTEGASNLYFTVARVRDTVLTGLSTATNAVIAATDTVLAAFGKLQAQITGHTGNTSNPHSVTNAQVGLGNVNNTADASKPVSTAQAAADIAVLNAAASDATTKANAAQAAAIAASTPVAHASAKTGIHGTTTALVEQSDIGSNPNQIPLNGYLGDMAFQSKDGVRIDGGIFQGQVRRRAPATKTADFTVADNEHWLICNGSASITVTLPDAATNTGREIMLKTIAAFTVVSASANVMPLAGGSAATAILDATAGKWATLVSDGTNWLIMQGD